MPQLNLDFLGVSVSLTADDEPSLDELRSDFAGFRTAAASAPARVRLALCAKNCPAPAGALAWGWRGFRANAGTNPRLIRWDDGSWARHDRARDEIELHARGTGRLRELALLATLSRAGEELDLAGLHRVHALGFVQDGAAGLILLPSMGGKSTLALEMLRAGAPQLLSDESPVVSRDGLVRPFPLRLALRDAASLASLPADQVRRFKRLAYAEKFTVAPSAFGAAFAPAAPLRWLFVGRSGAGPARIRPMTRTGALAALGPSMVIGSGLAQMSEYMLRADLALARIAASRLAAACALVRRAEPASFDLGSGGAAAALSVLRSFLRPRSTAPAASSR